MGVHPNRLVGLADLPAHFWQEAALLLFGKDQQTNSPIVEITSAPYAGHPA